MIYNTHNDIIFPLEKGENKKDKTAFPKDIFRSYETNKKYFVERWNEYFSRQSCDSCCRSFISAELVISCEKVDKDISVKSLLAAQ